MFSTRHSLIVCLAAIICFQYSNAIGISKSAPMTAALAKFDQVNVDGILRSDRLLSGYLDCLLGVKGCTRNAEQLKSILPELLRSRCVYCNPQQRSKVMKIVSHISVYKPNEWRKLKEMYGARGI